MKNIIFLLSILLTVMLIGCARSTVPDEPNWVQDLVATYEKDPVGNPPQSIWQYEYKGQTVYFVPAQCCEQYSTLYDAGGEVICSPDGGFTGQVSEKCPDFNQERTDEKLIWMDARVP
jgi:hypothetical protein